MLGERVAPCEVGSREDDVIGASQEKETKMLVVTYLTERLDDGSRDNSCDSDIASSYFPSKMALRFPTRQ